MVLRKREEIDVEKWNLLVDQTPGSSFFSYSWYLDAVAENWSVLTDEEYSFGIALPFSVRMGVKTLYTPIFIRALEWLGTSIESEKVKDVVDSLFPNRSFCVKQPVLGSESEHLEYQEVLRDDSWKINSQAKRMLKKAEKAEFIIQETDTYEFVFQVIQSELIGKHEGLDEKSQGRLEQLFVHAKAEGKLRSYVIEGVGGIVCLVDDQKTMYLKGAVYEEGKSNGAMYALLNKAIEQTREEGRYFDFGGSRVPGVKRFNRNLGGTDAFYERYVRDASPIWYKFVKSTRKLWKK